MDNLVSHNAKRKKRKTRKCLDEIRKRSQSVSVVNHLSIYKKPSKLIDPTGCKNGRNGNNNICITSKRLTLTMFAKAIKSETITRPSLPDGKKEHRLVVNTNSPASSPLNIIVEKTSSNDSANMSDKTDAPIRHSDFENHDHNEGNSSASIILFSPPNRLVESFNCGRMREASSDDSISTVTSTRITNEDFDQLHEELIDDISLYVRSNLSNFIKDDPMQKTKTLLKRLYIENSNQQHTSNRSVVIPNVNQHVLINDDFSTTPKETIVQDPMDYIRIGWRQGFKSNHTSESSPSEAGASPLHSPPVSIEIPSVITYTPDYAFYPHRLNE